MANDPQPRRHKCEDCQQVFECPNCTDAFYESQEETYTANGDWSGPLALYSRRHNPITNNRWLCGDCQ